MCTNPNLMMKVQVNNDSIAEQEWFLKKKKFKVKDGYAWKFFGKANNMPDYDLWLRRENLPTFKEPEFVSVPCGCCIECRLQYSREWASRCMLEAASWKHNWFITLTYDDDHLPKGSLDNPTLVPEHFTQFMKDLRTKYKKEFDHDNVRFYGCGEYGDSSLRPHYHLILFNAPLNDLTVDIPYIDKDTGKKLVIQKADQNGEPFYFSQFIKDCWKYGNILIGRVSWDSAAYVARYVLKKQKGINADFYKKYGMEPEFIRMSRRPGIAGDYFEINKEKILVDDKIYIYKHGGSVALTPPRFFSKLMEKNLTYNNTLCDNKIKRKERQKRRLLLEYSTSELSKVERDNQKDFLNKAKTLFKRNVGD